MNSLLFEEIAVSDGEARVVTLKKHAVGSKVTEADFHIETRTLPDLAEGDLLLETVELSPDAGMRGRMTGVDNFFVPQLPLGEVISGFGVARVLKSRNPTYPEREVVYGSIDWADRAVWGSAGGDIQGGGRRRWPHPGQPPRVGRSSMTNRTLR
jgi:NADPH-dependent curcumin reductase CurA